MRQLSIAHKVAIWTAIISAISAVVVALITSLYKPDAKLANGESETKAPISGLALRSWIERIPDTLRFLNHLPFGQRAR